VSMLLQGTLQRLPATCGRAAPSRLGAHSRRTRPAGQRPPAPQPKAAAAHAPPACCQPASSPVSTSTLRPRRCADAEIRAARAAGSLRNPMLPMLPKSTATGRASGAPLGSGSAPGAPAWGASSCATASGTCHWPAGRQLAPSQKPVRWTESGQYPGRATMEGLTPERRGRGQAQRGRSVGARERQAKAGAGRRTPGGLARPGHASARGRRPTGFARQRSP
jgi:hypothetical protein